MTKTCTFKSVLTAMLLLFAAQFAFAQTFWTETFSNQASSTTNWPSGGTNTGTETWKWTNVLNAGAWTPGNFTSPTGSTGYMWFDSDANGDGNAHDVTLTGVGVPANCTGKSNVHLKFYTYFRTFSGTDVARVGVSTDGTNFTYFNVPQFDALPPEGATASVYQGSIDIPLPQADGQAQVWIQFRYEGAFEYYWKVDDLELFTPVGPVPCNMNPAAIICDNFETYTIGNVSPQAAHWVPWSLNDADPVSAEVSTEFASQGTKSMKVIINDDQLLKLGNKSTGRYSLKWKQYVPTGKAAYINVQTDENAPGAASANFSFQCYFNANGTTTVDIPTPATAGTYPQNQWFTVEFVMDLDNNLAKFLINGGLARAWTYTQNFGAIDFYGADASYIFYVDEVEYINLPAITYNVDDCGNAIDLSLYFGTSPGVPQTTGIYNNTSATVDPTDPDPAPNCWADAFPATPLVPKIDGSMWYTFTADGGKYHIETVPCNSTDYIDDGDTQMAIYTGECGSLTQVYCNEDLTGAADFRAGLDIETTSGATYYMLVDGWSTPANGGFVAQGEFCIEITQQASITCDDGAVGTYTVANDGFVCNATTTGALFDLDDMSFVLPTIGPVFGVCWAISTEPVTPGTWPPSLASYWGSFAVSPNLYVPNLNNNGNPLTQNAIWYFTPVVVAGAVDTIPANAAFLHQLNIDDACFFVGESTPLILLGELAPLEATTVVTPASGGNNGAIALTVTGGIFDILQDPIASYTVSWTGPNGFTSTLEDLTGLAAGTYSCTITDVTGCADPYDFTVDVLTSVKDPSSVKAFTLTPNPTADFTTLNLTLANAADVRIEVVNTLGQTLQTLDAGKVNTLNQRVDLSRFADGAYFLRLTIDGETAIRRVVLQR